MSSSTLAPMWAQKLDLRGRSWLARYFLTRFPAQTQANPSLPRELVDEQVALVCTQGANPWPLVYAHKLDVDQLRAVVQMAVTRSYEVRAIVEYQEIRDIASLQCAIFLDPTERTAQWARRHKRSSGYDEMPEHVRRFINEATGEYFDEVGPDEQRRETLAEYRTRWFARADAPSFGSFEKWYFSLWLDALPETVALPGKITSHLCEQLREDTHAWDTFFSLSEAWDGTVGELLNVTKNLL